MHCEVLNKILCLCFVCVEKVDREGIDVLVLYLSSEIILTAGWRGKNKTSVDGRNRASLFGSPCARIVRKLSFQVFIENIDVFGIFKSSVCESTLGFLSQR